MGDSSSALALTFEIQLSDPLAKPHASYRSSDYYSVVLTGQDPVL